MSKQSLSLTLLQLLAGLVPASAWSIPDCSASRVVVRYAQTFTGIYRTGEPKDVVSISPNGLGGTLAQSGITIEVHLECDGSVLAGLPAEQIVLFHSGLCMCTPLAADHASDAEGNTQFTGAIAGGGCVNQLVVYAGGVGVGIAPVKVNSPDTGNCFVDSSDLSAFASKLGKRYPNPAYSICFDYNEDGYIDSGDFSFFSAHWMAHCP